MHPPRRWGREIKTGFGNIKIAVLFFALCVCSVFFFSFDSSRRVSTTTSVALGGKGTVEGGRPEGKHEDMSWEEVDEG